MFFRSKAVTFFTRLALIMVFSILAAACSNLSSPSESPRASESSGPNTGDKPSGTSEPSTPSPTPTSTPEPAPITAMITSAGDCVLHKTFQDSAYIEEEKRYDFYDIFSELEEYTLHSDFSLISFESAATNDRSNYTGYPMFNCPPEIFDAFKQVGFDLVNNSNNHQLDRKIKGMLETRENIRSRGLEAIGAYDGEEPRYLIRDLNGISVGFMAYTYGCNGLEAGLTKEQRDRHLALFEPERMKKELQELEEKTDITVVSMHWGAEYTQTPSDSQKKLARDLVSWGADIVLGSHPHVVQPTEYIEHEEETKYIIYSMGNFVSNQRRGASGAPHTNKELAEDGMLVQITLNKDPATGKTEINEVDHIPTWLWRYKADGTYKFKVIPVPRDAYYEEDAYPEDVLSEVYASYDRTMNLVEDYVSP